jgi:transposase-like protein
MDTLKLPNTLQDVIVYLSDPDRCFEYAKQLRWPDGKISCPRCQSYEYSFLSTRRMWFCKVCKKQFSLKVGTIFEDSPIGMDKWLSALWLLANCKNGVSSYEIHRAIGVTQKTAWFMLHRLRMLMHEDDGSPLSGEIEMDETFVGGKAKNMHAAKRAKAIKRADGTFKGKTIVVGMPERKGRVKAEVVEARTREVLHCLAHGSIAPGSTVYTDEHHPYNGINFTHEVINHADAYVRGNIHTNGIESFWSMLKRALGGTYISVEPFHLFRYIDEQAFRFNNRRDLDDRGRFELAARNVAGKRLTYAALTCGTGSATSL